MIHSNRTKILLISAWLAVITALLTMYVIADIPLKQYPPIITSFIKDIGILGPLLYIAIFMLRGVIFYPSILLMTSAGILFGPILGVAYTVIGENIAAIIAFLLIRYLGRSFIKEHEQGKLQKIDNYIKDHGFIATLILRLINFPFDIVNWSCGLSGIKFKEYFIATLIGSAPLIITFVLLGSSITNPKNLIASALIFISCLIISWVLHKKHKNLKIYSGDMQKIE